jgi:hypothetical protein
LILVLSQGRPRLFTQLIPQVDAILYTYLSGPYGGPALANIIFGRTNPSGKLSFPYPSANGQIAIPYGKWKHTPEWPLGFGLSYSNFAYSNFEVPASVTISSSSQAVSVSVTVTNMGPYAGMESVLLFMEDYFAYPTPEMSFMVRRFTKVSLGAQESVLISFTLNVVDFRHLIEPASKGMVNVTVKIDAHQASFQLKVAEGITVPLRMHDPLPKDSVSVQKLESQPVALPTAAPNTRNPSSPFFTPLRPPSDSTAPQPVFQTPKAVQIPASCSNQISLLASALVVCGTLGLVAL